MQPLGLLLTSLALCAHAQYEAVFFDDFSGPTLNPASWNIYDNKTHGDREWQLYLKDDVFIRDGKLVLRTQARDVSYGSKAYHFTSGWVDSSNKVEAKYGMYSARIRLPLELPGLWPAYWLVQDQSKCWPVGGEIDILEAVGGFRNDSVFGTYHWGAACGRDEWVADGDRNGDFPHPPSRPFSADFHNFSVWWNRTAISWAVDDQPYVSRVAGQPASLFVPSWPLFMIFNTALSFWAGPQPPPRDSYPQEMLVDSVGIWKWAGPGGDTGDFAIPYNATGLRPSSAPQGGAAAGLTAVVNISVGQRYPLVQPSTYVSMNLDYHYDGEEWPSWKGCSVLNMSLNEPNLVFLARSLSPAVLRVGGSEGDMVMYETPTSPCPPDPNRTLFCLTMQRWREINAFAASTGNKVAYGLNALFGRNKTCHSCPWDPTNARAFLEYAKAQSLTPYAFEFGNELTPFILVEQYAKDVLVLRALLNEVWPDAAQRPLLVTNDANPDAAYLEALLKGAPGAIDVATWHLYIGYGLDPLLETHAWSSSFMDKIGSTAAGILAGIAGAAFKGQVWVGESALAWHSGRVGVTDTFLSSPWWMSALGQLAPTHSGFCRQTLMGGNCSWGALRRRADAPTHPPPSAARALTFPLPLLPFPPQTSWSTRPRAPPMRITTWPACGRTPWGPVPLPWKPMTLRCARTRTARPGGGFL